MGDVRSADADRGPRRFSRWQRTALTVLACTGTTLLATPLIGYLDLANIVMLFLLTVLLIAVGLGRSAAVLAAVLSVLLFDVDNLQCGDFQQPSPYPVGLVTPVVFDTEVENYKAAVDAAKAAAKESTDSPAEG